jgi:hypothetical protein
MDRPMCPVAPKTSHTFGVGGLVAEGGSVVAGRTSLGSFWKELEVRRWVGLGLGDVGGIVLC